MIRPFRAISNCKVHKLADVHLPGFGSACPQKSILCGRVRGCSVGKRIFGLCGTAVLAVLPAGGQFAQDSTWANREAVVQENNSLLVATLSGGEIELHWLPDAVCKRVVSELAARSLVWGIRLDGSKVPVAKAQCRPRSLELSKN